MILTIEYKGKLEQVDCNVNGTWIPGDASVGLGGHFEDIEALIFDADHDELIDENAILYDGEQVSHTKLLEICDEYLHQRRWGNVF